MMYLIYCLILEMLEIMLPGLSKKGGGKVFEKKQFFAIFEFFTKQIKKSHKVSNNGAQNLHQIYH